MGRTSIVSGPTLMKSVKIGDVIHAQKIMPPGIVDEQRLQSLVAHRLAYSRYPFVEFLLSFHNHLVVLVSGT